MSKAAARRRGHGERGVGRERGGLAKEWGQTGRGDMQQSGNSNGGDETRKQKLGDGDDGNEANIPPTATAMGSGGGEGVGGQRRGPEVAIVEAGARAGRGVTPGGGF